MYTEYCICRISDSACALCAGGIASFVLSWNVNCPQSWLSKFGSCCRALWTSVVLPWECVQGKCSLSFVQCHERNKVFFRKKNSSQAWNSIREAGTHVWLSDCRMHSLPSTPKHFCCFIVQTQLRRDAHNASGRFWGCVRASYLKTAQKFNKSWCVLSVRVKQPKPENEETATTEIPGMWMHGHTGWQKKMGDEIQQALLQVKNTCRLGLGQRTQNHF